MRQILINAYVDYYNNYLSYDVWAEHNGMTIEQATKLLSLAREVMNSEHPDE